MSLVIKVENLSKQYRLGDVGTGTLRDDFKRWRYRLMGKEDPFLKIGEENDRNKKAESDYVWALKDINFEVEQGDVVGIIGRNGAGKSTLLKILSRTTAPTTGSVKVKGRIASLLEVGTGFHGELSGRENIYLNGAIMGLRKWEIDKKLDEIIDFAGVEKYLDTPVKRYSSGMYVRLAFAVAAHLEPDILIVDEVLAVGDAEFQKKCLGKMKDVSHGQGRTVLFVSHQMDAINNLCQKSILLKNGNIVALGHTREIIQSYLVRTIPNHSKIDLTNNEFNVSTNISKSYYKTRGIQLVRLFSNGLKSIIFHSGDNMKIEIDIVDKEYLSDIKIGVVIKKADQTPIIAVNNFHYSTQLLTIPQKSATIVIEFEKIQIIGEGLYYADLYLGDKEDDFDVINNAFYFEIRASNPLLGKSTLDSSLNSFYFENIKFVQAT